MTDSAGIALKLNHLICDIYTIFIQAIDHIVRSNLNRYHQTGLHQFLQNDLADHSKSRWLNHKLITARRNPIRIFPLCHSIEIEVPFSCGIILFKNKSRSISSGLPSGHPAHPIVGKQIGITVFFQKQIECIIIKCTILSQNIYIARNHLLISLCRGVRQRPDFVGHTLMYIPGNLK